MASTSQITARVAAVLARHADTRVIAIRARAREDWPDSLEVQDRQFALRWCESQLALREALGEGEAGSAGPGLVLLSPFGSHELPDDIRARLGRGQVYEPEGWALVRERFGVKEVDARLVRYGWMPQLLCELAGEHPPEPLASGFLDLETAWQLVLRDRLGLEMARPDVDELLQWTQRVETTARLDQLPSEARQDTLAWLSESAGSTGRCVLACMAAGRAADALPLGLVCGVVFAADPAGRTERAQAAVRLERYVQDVPVSPRDGEAWARSAGRVLRRSGALEQFRGALDRAGALLRELRITEFAALSDWLPTGFEQRLQTFGQVLRQQVGQPSFESAAHVERAAQAVHEHQLAEAAATRAERVRMACRLMRALTRPMPEGGLTSALLWQADEGAFVDWARYRLLGGDEQAEVSTAYAELRAAVARRRAPLARALAHEIAGDPACGCDPAGRVVPVEAALERVVAPLAERNPVLLLVLDGLSVSIFRELFSRPERHGWVEWVPQTVGAPLVGLAAFPTVTEVSRTSLLCGALTMGGSAREKSGFGAYPALVERSAGNRPPRLFHKGELAREGNLASEVREVLGDPQQKVTGVVYNAVDDHLSGPDQLHQEWSLEGLRWLLPLLREARGAGRVIIVTSDHGHVLEEDTAVLAGGTGDRWRPGDRADARGEVVLRGGRTIGPEGAPSVVCLWGEDTRYGERKTGYHGGLSPQEVTVPLSVFAPVGVSIPAWQPALPVEPQWWDQTVLIERPAKPAARPARRGMQAESAAPQIAMFEDLSAGRSPKVTGDWIAGLLASAVYDSQRKLTARVDITDSQMRTLLEALSERGGKISGAALAQRLKMPQMRLPGLLSAARRRLNVDQSLILQVDERSGTVELNQSLLEIQFKIGGDGMASGSQAAQGRE